MYRHTCAFTGMCHNGSGLAGLHVAHFVVDNYEHVHVNEETSMPSF